jgi:hypothetical protein
MSSRLQVNVTTCNHVGQETAMPTPKQTLLRIVAVALLSAVPVAAMAAAESDPAIIAIDAAIKSLQQTPQQNMTMTCIGMQSTSTGSGIGTSVTTYGGASGSRTTGLIVSNDGAQCTAKENAASGELSQKAIEQLSILRTKLEATPVDKPGIMASLTELGKTYVAPALQAVLQALILKRLGL